MQDNSQFFRQCLNNGTLLVSCIIQDDVYRLSGIFRCNFSQHFAYFGCSNITVIGDCKDTFCSIIYSTKNIISFSSGKSSDKSADTAVYVAKIIASENKMTSGKSSDKSADTAVYVAKIIASENKMRSIHKKKYQISFFCFFHQRVQYFMVEFVLGGCICFSRKRTAFQFFESIFFNSLLTAVTVTVILNLSLIISAIC